MKWTAASVKSLNELAADMRLDFDPELIRAIWKAETRDELETIYPGAAEIDRGYYSRLNIRELKREVINRAADYHGVEYLGKHKRTGCHVYYLNTGDMFAPTLMFSGRRMYVDWPGRLVEADQIAHPGY